MARKKRIPLSCLGTGALLQIQAAGFDVSKPLMDRKRGDLIQIPEVPYNKFGVSAKAERTQDEIVFDSKLEAQAYRMLRDRSVDFDLKPRYVLLEGFREPGGKKIRNIEYEADFLVRGSQGEFIIDMKGVETPVFKQKLKMMLAKGFVIHRIRKLPELLVFLLDRGLLKRP